LLILLLDGKWAWNDRETLSYTLQGLNYRPDNNYSGFRVDLSKISAMTIELQAHSATSQIWVVAKEYSWSSVSNDNAYQISYSSGDFLIRCTSFTTIDGKVHTKDNLNY
jgi:hypothetical protein